jgi:hypothetical protein
MTCVVKNSENNKYRRNLMLLYVLHHMSTQMMIFYSYQGTKVVGDMILQ